MQGHLKDFQGCRAPQVQVRGAIDHWSHRLPEWHRLSLAQLCKYSAHSTHGFMLCSNFVSLFCLRIKHFAYHEGLSEVSCIFSRVIARPNHILMLKSLSPTRQLMFYVNALITSEIDFIA